MGAITQPEAGRFRVDFARLGQRGFFARLRELLQPESVSVDPYRIGQAVCEVMRQSIEKDVSGNLLAWNDYQIYLSRADHGRLRPLRRRLQQGLDQLIRRELDTLSAQTVGDAIVRVLIDEENDLPRGIGEIVVSYVENSEDRTPKSSEEVTVRVRNRRITSPVHTQRVQEPQGTPGEGGLRIQWPGGEGHIAPGQRAELGRPHPNPVGNFIALTGASKRINSRQLAIESAGDGVVISRHEGANPVQIAGRLLQPGRRMTVRSLPVEISLSSGELSLVISQAGS